METRVAIVVDDFTHEINYRQCSDEAFYEKAEEQGNVFTLDGFAKYIESGELNEFTKNIHSTEYLMIRFIHLTK